MKRNTIYVIIINILMLLQTALGVSPAITSFNTGQVGALLEGNTGYKKYFSSSRTIENMLVAAQGPVFRRPGTKYIATQKVSSAIGRVAGFEHSVDDAYVLLFEDQNLRFFRDGGQILDSVGTEDISGLDNIIAHWLLNELEGVTVADDDGGTHNGTSSVDAVILGAPGKVGPGCFDLDGQYDVEVTDHNDFSFTDNSNDSAFSVACWAFITEKYDVQVLLSKWRDESSTREWRLSLSNNSKVQLQLADTSAGLASDRIAQWALNDDAADKIVLDEDATSHDGLTQISNTDVLSATGKINTALDFGGVDEVIITADNDELSFDDSDEATPANNEPMTIAAWAFITNSGNSEVIISKWDTGGAKKREWYIRLAATGGIVFQVYDDSASKAAFVVSDDTLSNGWHFIVGVYDDQNASFAHATAANFMTLYVDGAAVNITATTQTGYSGMENGESLVRIASLATGGVSQQFFADKLDNVMLFEAALSLANVQTLYNDGSGTETMGAATVSAVSDSGVSIGWHFLCATYSAPSDESTAADGIILYVDGAAVDSTATNDATYTAMQNGAEEVRIGSQRNDANSANEKFWADKMDEVSVYGDVLTPTEVASLFSTTPYEISTPYLTADLFDMSFKKSEDVMFVAHPDHEPRQLTRTGHTNWTLTALGIDDGPFQAQNTDTALTITPSAVTGNITLTASAELFAAGHVGSIWQINQQRDSSVYQGSLGANGSGTETAFFSGNYSFTTSGSWDATVTLERSTDGGDNWTAALTALSGINFDNPTENEEDGAIYRVTMSAYATGDMEFTFTITDQTNHGIVQITGVTDGLNATATVLTDLVDTTAASRWREGYFSDYRGWPATVTIHQQRLVFGGSASFPQTMWFGKTDPDEYTNFTEGTLDTSAFTISLAGQNPIRWLLSQDYLLIGTSGSCGQYGEQGVPITPTSPIYQEQTTHGSAAIRGIFAGDSILYIEREARVVREFVFNLQFDKYLSPNLTVLSPEITLSGIKDVAFQLRPAPVLWCVLNNGDMATLTYEREQAVVAWTKQITDGDFESVAIIPGSNEDEVWVTVNRTIDTNDARYVEQFQPIDWGTDTNDAWFVDSGLSYDGSALTDFNGIDHLVAENLSIYADTLIFPDEVVDANGAITIDRAASRVLVGMGFTSKLETLPLVIDPQDKPLAKRVRTVDFDFLNTGYCQYGNGASSTLTNINFKNDMNVDPNAVAQGLYTSLVSFKHCTWAYGTMKKQTIYVETVEPMPLTIRSIIPNYQIFP